MGAGAVYAPVTAARVRRLGWIVLAMAPVSMASELLGTAWVSFMSVGAREVGTGRVSLSIEGPDVYAVVIGLILLCFGHILSEAAEVAAENQSFV